MSTLRTRPHRAALAATAAALLLALTACGGDDGGADGTDGGSGDAAADAAADLDDVRSGDVPEECVEAFPLAIEPADLADVSLRPSDFPEPPVDATLCSTSSTLDDSIMTADYVTGAGEAEVLDGYEAALADYEVLRDDSSGIDTVTADLGEGVFVQVTPGDGTFSVAFGTE
ncbi:hypothetical protein GCM10023340_10880 [Nocardioides marinquilinus]|uniref:Uncharacterized protein n=1 Tax=Nocardioides marinquilinus TaxID=1210400 RepID=A0ABP9PBM0_9ACTN